MATQGPSYGFSREVKMKLKSKYDEGMEQAQRQWIAKVIGEELPQDQTFQQCLKDGVVLCRIMNSLQEGILKKGFPHQKRLNAFTCMENIEQFLRACSVFGVPTPSLFTTSDLYDDSNMSQVQLCLSSIINLALSKGIVDSEFGVYVAEKQEKNWTEEELRRGEGIIGLQAGTNKMASQSGMTPYGAPRTIYDKKYTGKGEEKTDDL